MSPSQKKKPKSRRPPPTLGQSRTQPWVRIVVVLIVAGLVLGSIAAILITDDDDGSSDVTAGSTVTTAARKPCVAVTDPLPAGAPEVPVVVGPPPATLVSRDLQAGTGATVEATSTITVDYIGVSCSTGKVFDTSYGKQPATFALAEVIPGWQQGLLGMKAGGTRLLGIPPDLAYGANGSPPDIGPNETLWFVVQVDNVEAAAPAG